MSVKKACEGVIKVEDSNSPGTFLVVGEVTSWSEEGSVNEQSYFKLGTCQEQKVSAGVSYSYSIEGNLDPADAGQPEILLLGEIVTIELYPVGENSGDEKVEITGLVNSFNRNGSGDALVTFSASISSNSRTVSAVA